MQKSEVPFFARFLEAQESVPKIAKGGGGIPPAQTMKYPSDDDDNPPVITL